MPDWVANAAGLLGMLALAYPALAADRLAGRLAALDAAARHPDTDAAIKNLRAEVLAKPVPTWRQVHRKLLYTGYVLLFFSYLLRFVP